MVDWSHFLPMLKTPLPDLLKGARNSTFSLVGFEILFLIIPFIKDNFEIVVFVIIFLSLLPMLFEYLKTKRQAKANRELEAGD